MDFFFFLGGGCHILFNSESERVKSMGVLLGQDQTS